MTVFGPGQDLYMKLSKHVKREIYDIEAAKKVQVSTIAFRSGGWSDADLAGAIAIYDGPADLLKHYDELPLAR